MAQKMPKEKNILFLTDSAADIPQSMTKGLDIEVLPFTIISDGKEYKDGIDFTPQKFYNFLLSRDKIPTHSQHTSYTFCQVYERLWTSGYKAVIYTAINALGSATYNNAVQAKQEFFDDHPEANGEFEIYIVDSRSYTFAYGWPVIQAAQKAQDGMSAADCAAFIENSCRQMRILFTPMDLKFAKKSGRVSAAAAFLGDALGMHPIMSFPNGESKVLSKVRGDGNVIPTLVKMTKAKIVAGSSVILLYGNNRKQNDALKEAFTREFGKPDAEVYVGGVISINAGPNLVGVVFPENQEQ